MANMSDNAARLETADGATVELGESLSIGRTPNNDLVVAEERVSRRHAVIQREENGRYWIADYGSRNGTFVNGRRITQPAELNDGDQVAIGSRLLKFVDEAGDDDDDDGSLFSETLDHVQAIRCWMLLADIADSTRLLHEMPAEQMRSNTKAWIAECTKVIERHGGAINTLLGDGFFAYWKDGPETTEAVDRFLAEFQQLQKQSETGFRYVLHHGPAVHSGGAAYEGCLSGIAVHYAFRLEKLAGALGEPRIMSEPAMRLLAPMRKVELVGEYELKGFDGRHPVFEF